MSERGFFSASNDIKTLDGNIFSGFPWLTTHLFRQKEPGAIYGGGGTIPGPCVCVFFFFFVFQSIY